MRDQLVRRPRLSGWRWPWRWRWPFRWPWPWRWCLWWGRCTPLVIAIRHADVDSATGPDPVLTAAGEARAEELRHVLGDAGITAIFVTSWQRTQLTAQPLAADLSLSPVVQDDVPATIAAVRALPRSTAVLLVGHTNTVPDLITGLGGPNIAPITASEFDRLFVLARGRLAFVRYGAET
jgi:broad specificity phosphatase PhoE